MSLFRKALIVGFLSITGTVATAVSVEEPPISAVQQVARYTHQLKQAPQFQLAHEAIYFLASGNLLDKRGRVLKDYGIVGEERDWFPGEHESYIKLLRMAAPFYEYNIDFGAIKRQLDAQWHAHVDEVKRLVERYAKEATIPVGLVEAEKTLIHAGVAERLTEAEFKTVFDHQSFADVAIQRRKASWDAFWGNITNFPLRQFILNFFKYAMRCTKYNLPVEKQQLAEFTIHRSLYQYEDDLMQFYEKTPKKRVIVGFSAHTAGHHGVYCTTQGSESYMISAGLDSADIQGDVVTSLAYFPEDWADLIAWDTGNTNESNFRAAYLSAISSVLKSNGKFTMAAFMQNCRNYDPHCYQRWVNDFFVYAMHLEILKDFLRKTPHLARMGLRGGVWKEIRLELVSIEDTEVKSGKIVPRRGVNDAIHIVFVKR